MKKSTLHLKFAKAIFNLAKKQQKTAEFFEQLTELSTLLVDQNLVKVLERMSGLEQSKLLDLLSPI